MSRLFFKLITLAQMRNIHFDNELDELNWQWEILENNHNYFRVNKAQFLWYIYSSWGVVSLIKYLLQR